MVNADASLTRTSFVGDASKATYSATCATGSAPSSSASLGAGLGGAVFASSSRLSLASSELTRCMASFGGGLFASNSSVTIDATRIENNEAAGGGAAVLGGSTVLTASDVTLDSNSALFAGALMILDSSSAALTSSSVVSNFASEKGGAFFLGSGAAITPSNVTVAGCSSRAGGVVFAAGRNTAVWGLLTLPSLANNTADVWGELAATEDYVMDVLVAPTVTTGMPLRAAIAVRDGFNQTVAALRDSTIQVSSPDEPTALTAPFVNTYDQPVSPVTGLAVTGTPGHRVRLQFVLTSRDLPAPLVQSVTVTIRECGHLEARGRKRFASF